MFKFEDEYNAIRAEKLSGSTKKILVLSLRSEADFNLAINERERIASSYFGGPCVYITSGMTIIFGSDESALDDVNNESYDKYLAKIVDNLISNGYRLDYDRSSNKDYNVLEARKSVNILGMTKQKTITTYIFRDKNILNIMLNYADKIRLNNGLWFLSHEYYEDKDKPYDKKALDVIKSVYMSYLKKSLDEHSNGNHHYHEEEYVISLYETLNKIIDTIKEHNYKVPELSDDSYRVLSSFTNKPKNLISSR